MRRRAAADHKESLRNARPSSTRSAGAGGSSGTMLKLYTDESPGLRVDPVVVLVLSLGFIFSVVGLHGKLCVFFSSPEESLMVLDELLICLCVIQSSPRSPASSPHKQFHRLYYPRAIDDMSNFILGMNMDCVPPPTFSSSTSTLSPIPP